MIWAITLSASSAGNFPAVTLFLYLHKLRKELRNMSNLFALIIGINGYLPNNLPGGLYFKNLRGCVADALIVENFLLTRIGVPRENIVKLTSTLDSKDNPLEPESLWPTYENIVNGFKKLTETAQAGDQVFIHYSGHGNRAKTTKAFQRVKEWDEVLVPMDIGSPGNRYLRDTELHHLLDAMVKRELKVTIALDSCHSGKATRLPEPRLKPSETTVRGADRPDNTQRTLKSLVASERELLKVWPKPKSRNADVGSGWLLEPKGYTLLAACRSNEEANEYIFSGQIHGVMSYHMVAGLDQLATGFTYRMLHEIVSAGVRSQFKIQAPQLEGEGDREVFGSSQIKNFRGLSVLNVNRDNTLVLSAGAAHGLEKGAKLLLFPLSETDLSKTDRKIGEIELTAVRSVESTANILWQARPGVIQPGSQAILSDDSKGEFESRVGMMRATRKSAASQPIELIAALGGKPDPFIKVVRDKEPADFLITVNSNNEYEIFDSDGTLIPNLKPLKRSPESMPLVVRRLSHLARFANVRKLTNRDQHAQFAKKIFVEILGRQVNYVEGQQPAPKKLKGAPVLTSGEWLILRIKNKYSKEVNITLFDLQCDWAISQIYPEGGGAFETVDVGAELVLPIQMTLPEGYESGVDIIKVFATVAPTNFRSLELPVLDGPPTIPAQQTNGNGSKAAYIPPNSRAAELLSDEDELWSTYEVPVEIRAVATRSLK